MHISLVRLSNMLLLPGCLQQFLGKSRVQRANSTSSLVGSVASLHVQQSELGLLHALVGDMLLHLNCMLCALMSVNVNHAP